MRTDHPITPTKADLEAWRAQAEAVNRFGGVRLGEFNWPWVVLSLIRALETDYNGERED